jgi:Tol biopolymer transport system component
LWVTDLETGRKQRLLPDFLMEHYNISPDEKRIVFITADGTGHAPLWIAPLDGSSAPRRLVDQDCTRALFAPDSDIYFVGGRAGDRFLQKIRPDGTGLQKVVPNTTAFLYDISPDGKWLAVWVSTDIVVYPTGGGSPITLCHDCGTAGGENRGVTPPLVYWSRDGKLVYLHSTTPNQTYAVSLKPGQILPPIPPSGLELGIAAHTGAGPALPAMPQERAFLSADDPSVYAYPRVTTHRNIYRIPVP